MRQMHAFSDFGAGLNTDAAPDQLALNELRIADNVCLPERGGAKKRNGFEAINDDSYQGSVTQKFEWLRDNGSIFEMAVIDGKLCRLDAAGRKEELDAVFLPKITYFVMQDTLYYLTGKSLKKYDGGVVETVEVADAEFAEGRNCSLSGNGEYLAVGHDGFPFVSVYHRDGDTYHKLSEINNVLESGVRGSAITQDGSHIALLHEDFPFLSLYKRVGESFERIPNPSFLPRGTGFGCSFSGDDQFLLLPEQANKSFIVYKREGDTFSKINDPPIFSDRYPRMGVFAGDLVLIADGGVTIYARTDNNLSEVQRIDSWITSISISPDGEYLVGVNNSDKKRIHVFKRTDNEFNEIERFEFDAPSNKLLDASISKDNHLVVISGEEATVYVISGSSISKVGSFQVERFTGTRKFEFSRGSNLMAYPQNAFPGVSVFEYTGNAFAKLEEPSGVSVSSPVHRCRLAVRHIKSQRYFYAGNPDEQSALYFSEPGEPGNVREISKMFPSTSDGPITGLKIFVDAVMVFFKRSIWVWRGIDPEIDAVWHKLPTSEGTVAPHSICHVKTGLMYLGERAIINLSPSIIGMNVEMETKDQAVYHVTEKRIETLIRSIVSPETTSAAYNTKTGEYFLSYSDAENDCILVINENLGISRWIGVKANDLYYSYGGELLVAMENFIAKPGSHYKDIQPDGTTKNVSMVVQTPQYALQSHTQRKLLTGYQIAIQGENNDIVLPAPTTFSVEVVVDNNTVVLESFEVEPSENLLVAQKNFRKTGNRASVTIKSADDKPFMLYRIGLEAKAINSYGERV